LGGRRKERGICTRGGARRARRPAAHAAVGGRARGERFVWRCAECTCAGCYY
jgi:hypothetical protein